MRETEAPFVKQVSVPAFTRVTVDPYEHLAELFGSSAPDSNPWSEGHTSFGMMESALRWAVAEGRVGGPPNHATYLLLADPQDASADVTITYLRENGAAPIVKTYTVRNTTRFTVDVRTMVPELQDEPFGAYIEVTNGVTIAVERSMYWDANGIAWAGGSNAPGTRLPWNAERFESGENSLTWCREDARNASQTPHPTLSQAGRG